MPKQSGLNPAASAAILTVAVLALAGSGFWVWKNRAAVKPGGANALAGNGFAVGQPAPEIAGEDLDGQSFALSDYRGKVVVLDFWGNW